MKKLEHVITNLKINYLEKIIDFEATKRDEIISGEAVIKNDFNANPNDITIINKFRNEIESIKHDLERILFITDNKSIITEFSLFNQGSRIASIHENNPLDNGENTDTYEEAGAIIDEQKKRQKEDFITSIKELYDLLYS